MHTTGQSWLVCHVGREYAVMAACWKVHYHQIWYRRYRRLLPREPLQKSKRFKIKIWKSCCALLRSTSQALPRMYGGQPTAVGHSLEAGAGSGWRLDTAAAGAELLHQSSIRKRSTSVSIISMCAQSIHVQVSSAQHQASKVRIQTGQTGTRYRVCIQ